jgi:hypothetical protein
LKFAPLPAKAAFTRKPGDQFSDIRSQGEVAGSPDIRRFNRGEKARSGDGSA